VLDGIPSGDQLQVLADCYGLDKDAELRFTTYDNRDSMRFLLILSSRLFRYALTRSFSEAIGSECIPSGDQLQVLADCYGLDKDAELRFTTYDVRLHGN
jgi:TusA-related sulfurtransferase